MVQKQSLDTWGVTAAITSIYSKSPAEQATIRTYVRTDFASWTQDTFLLNAAQVDYLDNMSPASLTSCGEMLADAMEEHDEILFFESSPDPATSKSTPRRGKELLMGRASEKRVAPDEGTREVFLVLINYYALDS